ncbi:hypothetical protein AB4K20DRAFT_1870320 [Rhizopus microsporus]
MNNKISVRNELKVFFMNSETYNHTFMKLFCQTQRPQSFISMSVISRYCTTTMSCLQQKFSYSFLIFFELLEKTGARRNTRPLSGAVQFVFSTVLVYQYIADRVINKWNGFPNSGWNATTALLGLTWEFSIFSSR